MNCKTKIKGDASETKALFEFQKRDIQVLTPWGDNSRYDLVIEINNNFYRIQAKTANEEHDGAIKCYCRSSYNHTTNKRMDDYQNQVDFFFFYNFKYDISALVPIDIIGNRKSLNLRITPPKNHQNNVLYFNDFSIDKILCVETLHGTSHEEEEKVQTTMAKATR